MRDILRHEYGHAFAVEHPSLVRRSREFCDTFGGRYDSRSQAVAYSQTEHVTEYAATSPQEDFAETFMTYVRAGGRVSKFRRRGGVYRKLQFVRALAAQIRRRNLL